MKLWNSTEIVTELDRILPYLEKPGRYTGGEFNAVVKEPAGKIRVCLIYPDAYEIGMSNLGIKLLYHILNREENVVCETCFAPWFDLEQALRDRKLPLFSLGTKTPLSDFDVLAFSFQYELIYTNFLNMLELSGIPFYANERGEHHPLIIAGGPATANPEPVAPFLDAICIGDGESRIVEMVRAVGTKSDRSVALKRLSEIEGVYVPALYSDDKPVIRYIEPDLNRLEYNITPLLPNIRAVQDRAMIEVSRGCTRGCRFCQAGSIYRPVRERNISTLLNLARESIRHTGYREFSLISLSISDYSRLGELIEVLDGQFSEHGISFSLPSLRLDSFTMDLAEKVKEIRKSGLTFAVEGGTQAVRDSINKGTREEELMNVIEIARRFGWRQVKLYFMIGLPCEGITRDEEAQGIVDLVFRIHRRFPSMNVTVSVGTFVPKPHTPYQRYPQITPDESWRMFNIILDPFRKNRKVNIRFNDPLISQLEGIFSRGDRALAPVIETAYRNGARFDGWSEHYRWDVWESALRENGIDITRYLDPVSAYGTADFPLPWRHIEAKMGDRFLEREWERSTRGELTSDCRDKCEACLSCDFDEIKYRPADPEEGLPSIQSEYLSQINLKAESAGYIRFQFEKKGMSKYISTVDLDELFFRAFIRANLPIKFSEGFNPHMKLEMGWAVPVGYESTAEVCQVELHNMMEPERFISELNAELPETLRIVNAVRVDPPRKLNKTAHHQFVRFRFDQNISEEEIITHYRKNINYEKVTPKKTKTIRLDEYVKEIRFDDERVIVDYRQTDGGARIQDIIHALTGRDIRDSVALNPVIEKRYLIRDGDEVDIIDA